MKMTRTLIASAALAPFTLFAQSPPPAAPAAGGVAPVTSPAAGKLPQIQFDVTTLGELVAHLQARSKDSGHDPNVDPLNVVLSPGLENQAVPSLSLRNVSPTEVLTVATTVLGLHLEPVPGDSGETIAWLVKGAEGQPVAAAAIGAVTATPAPAFVAADPNIPGTGTAPSGFAATPGNWPYIGALNPVGVPYTVQLAASPPSSAAGGGGGSGSGAGSGSGSGTGSGRSLSQVFGVAALISSEKDGAQLSAEGRSARLERLILTLNKMAADNGGNAQINAYSEMDLLVVKTADSAVMALISDAIEALKSNVAKSDNSSKSREEAFKSEIMALRGQLSIVQTEKDMQRQTLLDQIELLKAGQKAEDTARKR